MSTPERATSRKPTDLARAALKRIGEQHLPPTPKNFTRFYNEAAGVVQETESITPPSSPVADPHLVEQIDLLVGKIVATSEDLMTGIDEGTTQMAVSLDGLVNDAPLAATVQLLQAIVAVAKDMHVTMRASRADLLDTQQSLAEIRAELTESRKLLGQDALTGTDNRRAMDVILAREISRARRESEPLTVAMVDLDHFKHINDTYGHAAGDAALVHVTQLAKSMLRGHDAFIRYGGEEFLLVLPETALQGAVYVTGRIQAQLRKTPLIYAGKTIAIAFSAGVAELKIDDSDGALLRRADAALYEAKRSGRDRVVASE